MKKLFLVFIFIVFGMVSFAQDPTLSGEAVFEWVDMSQVQRNSNVEIYRKYLFGEGSIPQYSKAEFKEKFADFKKDVNRKTNYRLTRMGQTETDDANLCAFFYKNDILLIYAIQYKNNPKNVYYYDAYGHLKYVDVISENYPDFPYSSKQYRANGKLVSAIYFVSPNMQYMYEPDGKFKGLWYKEKMYDINGKQTLERSNWGI